MAHKTSAVEREANALVNLFNSGRYAEMEECARKMIVRYPRYGIAWKALGTALLQQGRGAEALAPMQQAAGLLADDAAVFNTLGSIFNDQGRYIEAEHSLSRALALKPDFAEAHYNLGNTFQKQGRFLDAETSYRRALALKPDFITALISLGMVYQKQGQLAEAETCFRQILERAPQLAVIHFHLATLLKKQARPGEAEASYRRALEVNPGFVEALVSLGEMLHESSRFDEAEAYYRRVLEIAPDHAQVHINLGEFYRVQGRFTEAETSYRRALAIKSDYAELHGNLGVVLQEQNRLTDAEASFRCALEIKPDYLGALNNLGNLLKNQCRYAESDDCYRRALQIDPVFVEAHNSLGVSLNEQGRLIEAEACCKQALTINPNYCEAHNNLGVTLRNLARPLEAESSFRQALKINPDYSEAHFCLALMLLGSGRFAEGWREYAWRLNRKGQPRQLSLATKLDRLLPFNPAGFRIVLWKDQGLGDELFFLRYANALRKRGAWVGYVADPRIAPFIRRAEWVDAVVLESVDQSNVQINASIGDLPLISGMTAVTDIQPPIPLSILPDKLQEISQRLEPYRHAMRPLIGITWQGGNAKRVRGSLFKHIPPSQLAAALREKEAIYVIVQRNPSPDDLAEFKAAIAQPVLDFSDLNNDLEGMLALLSLLDEYIGVSNTNMHLRAGLGKTAHVLVPYPPDFRWLGEGDSAVWFPGFTVHRAESGAGWDQALMQLKNRIMSDNEQITNRH